MFYNKHFTIKKKWEHQTALYWPLNCFQKKSNAKKIKFSSTHLQALTGETIEQRTELNTWIIWALDRGRKDAYHTNPLQQAWTLLRQGQSARREWTRDKSQIESLPPSLFVSYDRHVFHKKYSCFWTVGWTNHHNIAELLTKVTHTNVLGILPILKFILVVWGRRVYKANQGFPYPPTAQSLVVCVFNEGQGITWSPAVYSANLQTAN